VLLEELSFPRSHIIGGEYTESGGTEDGVSASYLDVSGVRDSHLSETREEMPRRRLHGEKGNYEDQP
jgi:hypothetical protein